MLYGYFTYICVNPKSMEAQISKDERLELRVSKADKQIFKKAQELSGDRSLSSFIISVVKKEAQAIVTQNDHILASEQDREIFFDTVFSDVQPNDTLVAAAAKYKSKQP